jgi:hypothetical protein
MMRNWKCTLQVTRREAKLLVTEPDHGDLLKARLDPRPRHPRALLTTLEGLSLWSGKPLCVALHVDRCLPAGPSAMLFGDELWPAESALVRFEFAHRDSRQVRLTGLGDFRAMRKVER